MDNFPTSFDYFSPDNGSQGSSATVTPWNSAIPRTFPTLENMPLMDEDAMDAPPPYNYIHSPSEETDRLTKSSNSDDYFLAVNKNAVPGKRSRFSEFFRWNPSTANKPKTSEFTATHGTKPEHAGFNFAPSPPNKDIWGTNHLQSAIQPVNPRLGNLVPFLERSVWRTNSDEIARHIRTTSEEKLYKAQLAPIGTPFAAKKPSIATTPHELDLFAQIALSEQEVKEILSKNWETPTFNPLTGREVSWLMRLNPDTTAPKSTHKNNTAVAADVASPQPATTIHSRNVSTDSSRGSLSPEPSSSPLIASAGATATTPSPATSTSTVAQANAHAQAKRTPSINFTNAEAQAQQAREIEIACMKERRAREAVLRPLPMPFVAPASAPVPVSVAMSMSMLQTGSKLAIESAEAKPFVPTVDGMGIDMGMGIGMTGLGEKTLGKDEWASLLEARILELKGALEMVTVGGEESEVEF